MSSAQQRARAAVLASRRRFNTTAAVADELLRAGGRALVGGQHAVPAALAAVTAVHAPRPRPPASPPTPPHPGGLGDCDGDDSTTVASLVGGVIARQREAQRRLRERAPVAARAIVDERQIGRRRAVERGRRVSLLGRPDGSRRERQQAAEEPRGSAGGRDDFWQWAARKNTRGGGGGGGGGSGSSNAAVARFDRLGRRVVPRVVQQETWERYRSTDERWCLGAAQQQQQQQQQQPATSAAAATATANDEYGGGYGWAESVIHSAPPGAGVGRAGAVLLKAALSALDHRGDPRSAAHAAAAEHRVVEREKELRMEMWGGIAAQQEGRPSPHGRFYDGITAA